MSSKGVSARPGAEAVLDSLRRATRGEPTQSDEFVARISSNIIDPGLITRAVQRLSEGKGSWGGEEFSAAVESNSAVDVLFNSSFIRAAARAGFVFYLGPDRRVYRQTVARKDEPRTVAPPLAAETIHTTTESVQPAEAAPQPDADYFVEPEWYSSLQGFVEEGSPTLLIGPPGTGKTVACERVFAERRQILHIVSCKQSMTADDLEGRIELRSDNGASVTRFEPSEVALASEHGHGVLLDEADAIPAHASFGVFRLLDGKDMRILRMGADGRVPRHKEFRIVGTQNTEGRGDEKGIHHGRSYQDEAFLDRWENVIRVGYLPKADEINVLVKRTGVSPADAEMIVESASLLRKAADEDAIMFCCTMRRTISVARNVVCGLSPVDAWSFSALNRATKADVREIREILGRVYGSAWRGKSKRRTRRKNED